ncbi:SMP-30/gluconolactonase/LRE family protein [Diplocloster modestus]|uniref:SMP-30/gluconolactonase/LRE family protein n=1 Tax=Diplocloster modestus TaxID=2850322 RepID=A0ABS6KB99_9FIRM|nr:SMP-30/gluconolactonase/LRE family protein [Diplocloster modestus]MBU9727791.1 SMP-30/gluconolactonase/LRE family protein [Diplocloster modestus]
MSDIMCIPCPDIQLGESPVWSYEENCLYFIDITGKRSCRIDWSTKELYSTPLPKIPGCLVLTDKNTLLYGLEDGIYDEKLIRHCSRDPASGKRFNDGKAGPDGKLYVGTISGERKGFLYRMEGELKPVIQNVGVSNGLDWSLDEKTMYYCDTASGTVSAYYFPEMRYKKLILRVDSGRGRPDGLCVDVQGMIWLAVWGIGQVWRIHPEEGKVMRIWQFPARNITCPVFGGKNMQELIVTSARVQQEKMQGNNEADKGRDKGGSIFTVIPGICGRRAYRVTGRSKCGCTGGK